MFVILVRCPPPERCPRSAIETGSDCVESGLVVDSQVAVLVEVLPQEPIGVFVRAALPRTPGLQK